MPGRFNRGEILMVGLVEGLLNILLAQEWRPSTHSAVECLKFLDPIALDQEEDKGAGFIVVIEVALLLPRPHLNDRG
jgi:hypothetical protein